MHPNMLDKLRRAGLSEEQFLQDARPLLESGWEAALTERGFEPEKPGIYSLGEAHLYGAGQRAIVEEDGKAQLLTFADRFVQIIRVNPDGRVTHNSVQKLP